MFPIPQSTFTEPVTEPANSRFPIPQRILILPPNIPSSTRFPAPTSIFPDVQLIESFLETSFPAPIAILNLSTETFEGTVIRILGTIRLLRLWLQKFRLNRLILLTTRVPSLFK